MKIQVRKPSLLTVQEVATHLAVSPRTVYRLMREYRLPAYRIGGQWRFKLEAIEAWMREEHVQSSRSDFEPRSSDAKELATRGGRQGGRYERERMPRSTARGVGGSGSTRPVETILLSK